jgi:mannosyltransferase
MTIPTGEVPPTRGATSTGGAPPTGGETFTGKATPNGGATSTGEATAPRAPGSAMARGSGSESLTELGRYLALVAPPLLTFVVTLWGITASSYWRDEAATLVAVQRPFGQLLRMLGNIDAVHGAYYVIIWVVVRLGGTGELVVRLPSALAMAVAAAAVAAIGRRLVSSRAGLFSGLVFAVLPATSYYAQDARADATAVGVAAVATYLLVRILQDGGISRRWLILYGACLTALGLIDILGLLLIAAHAVAIAAAAVRQKDHAARRALVVRWLIAVAVALVLVSPLGWLVFHQRAAVVSWVAPLSAHSLRGLAGLVAPKFGQRNLQLPFALGLVAVVGFGLLISAAGGRAWLRRCWPPDFAAICWPWLIVPPVLLAAISVLEPIYTVRYVLFCLPAVALIVGAALAALGRVVGAVLLVGIVLLGLPQQHSMRRPGGHGENIRRADHIVANVMHPGDAAIFHNASVVPASWSYAYPFGFAQLRDISQAQTPAQSGTLNGTLASAAVVRQRLSRLSRVWVVDLNYRRGAAPTLHSAGFRLVHMWQIHDVWLLLYTRGTGT